MIIDSHIHLDAEQYNDDLNELLERAKEAGVSHYLNVGYDAQTIPSTLKLVETHPNIYGIIGWHPNHAHECELHHLDWIESLMSHPKVVALGEIGLDYHWMNASKEVQQALFRTQIGIAKKHCKPIVIHNRDAHQDCVSVLREEAAYETGGVMHCFSGSWEIAKQCLDANMYLSFGGPLTFNNAKTVKEVIEKAPLDRILIETDGPYLAPHPYRGKRNEPAYLVEIAKVAAQIRGISLEQFIQTTRQNTINCFRLKEFHLQLET